MYCRLCIGDCDDCKDLYDAAGEESKIYKVAAKYFEEQLGNNEMDSTEVDHKYSRVICANCWTCINDFYEFEKTILAAQQHYKQLMQQQMELEKSVKLEFEIDLDAIEAVECDDNGKNIIETDPVGIGGKEDGGTDWQNSEENNSDMDMGNACQPSDDDDSNISDDDKPLIARKNTKSKDSTKDVVAAKKLSKRKINSKRTTTVPLRKKKIAKKPKKEKPADPKSTDDNGDDNDAKIDGRKDPKWKTHEYDEFIALHWKREMHCDICDEVAPNFTALHAHYREAHGNDKGYVICCNHKFRHRFHLVEHLRLHLDPQHFKCPQCGKCSTSSRNLATHIKAMHGPQPLERRYECEVCGKRFFKKTILSGHMDIHAQGSKDYVCKDCGKGFVLEHRLRIHERNVHSTAYHGVCELCGKSFRGRYALKAHLQEHDGVGKQKWPCDQCDAQLYSKYSLKRHKRVTHHDGSTLYVCSECGKVSLTENALRSHKKYVHQIERKFKCNICDKAFKVAIVLKEHMTTHTGQDLYKCPHCPKTFKVSANMHHHRKRAHPKEFEENRQRRSLASHIDLSHISNEVVL